MGKDRAVGGQARELTLRRAAHVPDLRHNFLSAAQLTATLEHPMTLWPRAAVFKCVREGWSVILRIYARCLFEASARRSAIAKWTPSKALVAVRPQICDIMTFADCSATLGRISRAGRPRRLVCD